MQEFPDIRACRRILVVGPGGAGKSTLARKMGDALGLPVVHLDSVYWRPGWVATPKEEWVEKVRGLLAGERWIIDGNYVGSAKIRFAAADAIVFLDFPRRLSIRRVLGRVLRHRGRTRPDMGEGCPEKLSLEFLVWLWSFPRDGRPRLLAALADEGAHARHVILRSPREVARFLASLEGR